MIWQFGFSALPLRLCVSALNDWNVPGKTAETQRTQTERREELRDLLFF